MKKAIIIVIIVAFALLSIAPFAMAAEINPAPGTYNFGSTSEFSPYAQLSDAPPPTPGGGGLAPTGQNIGLMYVLAIAAISAPLIYLGAKKIRKS